MEYSLAVQTSLGSGKSAIIKSYLFLVFFINLKASIFIIFTFLLFKELLFNFVKSFWVDDTSTILGSNSTKVIFLIKSYFNKFLTANQSHHHKTKTLKTSPPSGEGWGEDTSFIGQSTKALWYLFSSKLLNWIFQFKYILKSSPLFVNVIFWYLVW